MNKIRCGSCGTYRLEAFNAVVKLRMLDDSTRHMLVCQACYNALTGHHIDVYSLARQVKHNERRDMNINNPVPVWKR